MNRIRLRSINDNDIELMKSWLNKEYILKWYEDPEAWINEIKGRKNEFHFISHYIVLQDSKPIGFCQYYTCSYAGEDWYGGTELKGTYSIDYLIGEEEFLGKGYGKEIIELLVKVIFSIDSAKRIIVLPDPENKPSVKALLANGFIFDDINSVYLKAKE